MKKFLFFLLIVILGILGFYGFIKADKEEILIIKSKLRKKKILLPGQWTIYPEIVIPGVVQTNSLAPTQEFSGDFTLALPSTEFYDYLNKFKVKIDYEVVISFNESNKSLLLNKNIDKMKTGIEKKIKNKFQKIINDQLKNLEFTKKQLLVLLNKIPFSKNIEISYEVITFPSWKRYTKLTSLFNKWMDENADKKLLDLGIKHYEKSLRRKEKQQAFKENIKIILELGKKIKQKFNEKDFKGKEYLLKLFQLYKGMKRNEKNMAEESS